MGNTTIMENTMLMEDTTLTEDTLMQLEEKRYENHENQVELVIPSTGDANRLYGFIKDVTEVLSAKLVKITGSWEENIVTLELDREISADQMTEHLSNIPEVATAEQKQVKTVQGAASTQISVMLKEIAMDSPDVK